MSQYGPIDQETGMPKEYVSCPGCGKVYGYQNRKACKKCEECAKCHRSEVCPEPEWISGHDMKLNAAENS